MKRKSTICMLLAGMMLGMFSTSCQDMLSPDSERHAYTVAEDTLYSYWGILKSLQNIAERYVILNECRGDLVDETSFVSDTIGAIVNFGEVSNPELWKDGACAYLNVSDYYHIINSCNAYIAMCDTARTTGTNKKYMIKEYAQVQSIRAWVYMQLLYAYGENRVPFYTEPMLTTDDIYSFVNDKSHPKLTTQILAQELAPKLEEMEPIEVNLGLPQYEGMPNYNNYGDVNSGNSHFVCHSSKCMFPVSLVLGDLYLLCANGTGDVETYRKAAQHYYNYINTQVCGPLPVDRYFCRGLLDERVDYPIYTYGSSISLGNISIIDADIPYIEDGPVSRSTESITCIPSNKGKLEGKVMTDINRLFGFEAQMRTSTYVVEDDNGNESGGSSSYVSLSREYERELIPSKGYEALCDSQKYEIYVGTTAGNTFTYESIQELPGVGDARRTWIYQGGGRQWNFYVGDDILYGKMVSKQNPEGIFSTTYPVIYRKSTVWLRFAEALNRAGFPGYAFAILKNGLCNNSEDWFPTSPKQTYANRVAEGIAYSIGYTEPEDGGAISVFLKDYDGDYPIKDNDLIFCYCQGKVEGDDKLDITPYLPEGWDGEHKITDIKDLIAWYRQYAKEQANAGGDGGEDGEIGGEVIGDEIPVEDPTEGLTDLEVFKLIVDNIRVMPANDEAFKNTPSIQPGKGIACYYLDRREVERAANTPFLDFKQPYLRGQNTYQRIYVKEQGKLFNSDWSSDFIPVSNSSTERTFTMGVHQRGCGFVRYDDPEIGETGENMRSSYNYVGLIKKYIKKKTGKDVTADDIYSGSYDAQVQDAVEDLIIDECALELAFEGSRFSDLCRVAMRRGDNNYLAERVAKRHTGEVDERLRSRLNNRANWFLPLPE